MNECSQVIQPTLCGRSRGTAILLFSGYPADAVWPKPRQLVHSSVKFTQLLAADVAVHFKPPPVSAAEIFCLGEKYVVSRPTNTSSGASVESRYRALTKFYHPDQCQVEVDFWCDDVAVKENREQQFRCLTQLKKHLVERKISLGSVSILSTCDDRKVLEPVAIAEMFDLRRVRRVCDKVVPGAGVVGLLDKWLR